MFIPKVIISLSYLSINQQHPAKQWLSIFETLNYAKSFCCKKEKSHKNFQTQENPLLQLLSTTPVMRLLPCSEGILQTCMIPQGSWHPLSALFTVLTLLFSGWTFSCLIWILTSWKPTHGCKWIYSCVCLTAERVLRAWQEMLWLPSQIDYREIFNE